MWMNLKSLIYRQGRDLQSAEQLWYLIVECIVHSEWMACTTYNHDCTMMVWINACMNKSSGWVSFFLFSLTLAHKTFQLQLRWMDISGRRSVFSGELCLCWPHAAAGQWQCTAIMSLKPCGGKKGNTTLVNVLVFMWILSTLTLYLCAKCSLCFRWLLTCENKSVVRVYWRLGKVHYHG